MVMTAGAMRATARAGPRPGRIAGTGTSGSPAPGYLLDPTLDQVNDVHRNMHLPPVVLPLLELWDAEPAWRDGNWMSGRYREWCEKSGIWFRDSHGTDVRCNKYYRQVGWRSACDARPSHWQPIVRRMVDAWFRSRP